MTAEERDFPSQVHVEDQALRDRFVALRREEEAHTPDFAALSRRRAGNGTHPARWQTARRLVAVAACMVIMISAVLWFQLRPQHPEREQERPGQPIASITNWRPPTDFLLATSGQELLQTVPSIGVWHDYANAPRQKQKHLQSKRQLP